MGDESTIPRGALSHKVARHRFVKFRPSQALVLEAHGGRNDNPDNAVSDHEPSPLYRFFFPSKLSSDERSLPLMIDPLTTF